MKTRLLIALLLCAMAFAGLAQEMAINFTHDNWETVLAQAKAENKIIFVDAYTTWCGPCKMMDSNVFTDEKVGEIFNESFINAKIDMEKGEGLEFARKYSVRAYPSFLFIDGDGQLVHRGLGYQPASQFLDLAVAALDDNRSLGGLERRYAAGERDEALLKNYADALSLTGDEKASEVADAYLATQKDWSTPENRAFVLSFANATDSKAFEYLATHRASFEEEFGKSRVIGQMQNVIFNEIIRSQSTRPGLEEIDALVTKAYPDLAPVMMARFKMTYYMRANDMEKFQKAAVDYIDNHNPDDANELNSVAWTFYEGVEDPAMLKRALEWAKRSVEIEEGYANTDTLAALYYKTGDKEKGLRYARAAIKWAKSEGADYSGTEELIEKYK